MPPLNILYFITHDSGRFFGCYDRPITASPNIDRFAAEGVNFTNAFCSSPACGPSRSCVMTGKYAHNHRMMGTCGRWSLPEEDQTLVDHFNDAGIQTAHFGFTHERRYGNMRYEIDGEFGSEKEHYWDDAAEDVVDHAIEFLTSMRDPARPFFLHCATGETHESHYYVRLREHGGPYPLDEVYIPPNTPDVPGRYISEPEIDPGILKRLANPRTGSDPQIDPASIPLPRTPPAPGVRERMALHYASVRYVDTHFQRLLDALDSLGLRDKTLIVFTTDHGLSSNARSKGFMYDCGVEIALAMQAPAQVGGQRGAIVNHLIPNIDVMPTLLQVAGLTPPAGIPAQTFWPLLVGESYTPRDYIFTERNFHGEGLDIFTTPRVVDMYDPVRTIRTNQYHYLRNFLPHKRSRQPLYHEITGAACHPWFQYGSSFDPEPSAPRPAEELYHITHDPTEQIDVAQRPEYARIKARLSALLEQIMQDTNDFALSGEVPAPYYQQESQPIY